MVSPSKSRIADKVVIGKLGTTLPLLLVFSAWAIVNFSFVKAFSGSEYYSDYYRHTDLILIPFLNGDAGLSVLFTNHHATPLLHLHQLANFSLFDGDLRFDAYFGFFVLTILCGLAGLASYRYFQTKLRLEATIGITAVAITIPYAILTGIHYAWPLISVQLYFVSMGLFLLWVTQKVLSGNLQSWRSLFWILAASSFMLLLHETYGTLFVATSMTLVLTHAVFHRWKRGFALAFVQCLLIGTYLFWISSMAPEQAILPPTDPNDFSLFTSLDLYLRTTGAVVLETITGQNEWFARKNIPVSGLFAGLIINIIAALYCLRKDRNIIIAGLIIFGFGFALSATIFRGANGVGFVTERYIHIHKIVSLGVVLASIDLLRTWMNQKAVSMITLLISILLVTSHFLSVPASFEKGREFDLAEDQRELLMMAIALAPDESQFWTLFLTIGKRKGVLNTIDFLQDNQLNIFSKKYKLSPMADGYKRAYTAFQNYPQESIVSEPEDPNKCFNIAAAKYLNFVTLNGPGQNDFIQISKRKKKMETIHQLPTPRGKVSYYVTLPKNPVQICLPDTARIEKIQIISDTAP